MAGHEHSQVRPKTEQDRSLVAAGSPLAIQGIFLEVIRERFSENAGLDWVWRDDPTTTDILIEASYNEETESRSQTPAIYVTRLQTRPQQTEIGDRAGVRLKDHLEGFSALMDVAMSIECVSNDTGESAIIADIVQFLLIASSDEIQKQFGFYNLEHAIMGQTTPFEAATPKWSTPLNFTVSFWVRWSQVPIAPLLQQIAQRAYANKDSNFFMQTVLNSMRRSTDE